jgi:pyruvate/2-oxoglutarate dehydrogenase complex dihydrolipoamide dehydrogenase (E3) component
VREFDVVVLGAGSTGEVAAGRLGQNGVSVAIVEQALVGGDCSYYACMPSKALLRPIDLAAEAARVAGLSVGPIDVSAVLARRDEVIHRLDDSVQLPWLDQHGVTLVRGRGLLVGERRVLVGDEELVARKAVIVATGSSPFVPDVPGLRAARPWTSRDATTANEIPERLAILGGGVVGVELAAAYSGLGARVVLVHREKRLIDREEPFASEQLLASLRARGIDVRLGTEATQVSRADTVLIELDDGSIIEADELLVAVGRQPNTTGIGLETLGIEEGVPLAVGDDLRVRGHDWLYAAGDVNGRVLLTHMGKYQARLIADAIMGKQVTLGADGARSPRVIFTDPQVAAVGVTVAGALDAGLAVRHVDVGTGANAGGSFIGHGAEGTARMVVELERRVIVGFTVTGPEVAESLHAATIAITAGLSVDELWHAVPVFPTRSELWLRLLEAYGV